MRVTRISPLQINILYWNLIIRAKYLFTSLFFNKYKIFYCLDVLGENAFFLCLCICLKGRSTVRIIIGSWKGLPFWNRITTPMEAYANIDTFVRKCTIISYFHKPLFPFKIGGYFLRVIRISPVNWCLDRSLCDKSTNIITNDRYHV